ncbi:hypothetical protein L798_00277 [Zootermopsis nevadensis]|uniref:Uncharacterized protein n=1 Tax=Zootermopsis nevadensis TaxID=136037 RepID=A0A067QLE0_ZOONE|nr:hypothetical protein L798_00277 [Zootermopsis nevadensis]
MGSQLRAPKRKNAPGTPPLGSHKLRKVARIERTATLGTIACPIQQTVVPRIIFARVGTNNDTEASNMTTYTDFQEHLEVLKQQETCRSSMVAGHCLRERNTPARTLSKIPSKILLPRSTKKMSQARVTLLKPLWKNVAAQGSSSRLQTSWGTPKTPMNQRGTAVTCHLTTRR